MLCWMSCCGELMQHSRAIQRVLGNGGCHRLLLFAPMSDASGRFAATARCQACDGISSVAVQQVGQCSNPGVKQMPAALALALCLFLPDAEVRACTRVVL